MILLFLLFLLIMPSVAFGADIVCGNSTKLERFTPSTDATKVPPCPAPFVLSSLPDDEVIITAQRDLYRTMSQSGTLRHLKVINGLMEVMTETEKAEVDAPINQKKAATDIANNEIKTNEVCANHTLTDITAYWKGPGGKQAQLQATIADMDTAIAAVATGTAKTALTKVRDGVVAHMTMFINDSELQWRYICSRTFIKP